MAGWDFSKKSFVASTVQCCFTVFSRNSELFSNESSWNIGYSALLCIQIFQYGNPRNKQHQVYSL